MLFRSHDPIFFELANYTHFLKDGKIENKNLQELMIENFDDSVLIIEGASISEDFKIPIPDKLVKMFREHSTLVFEPRIMEDIGIIKTFSLLPLNEELFNVANKETWGIVTKDSILFPRKFKESTDNSRKIKWKISKEGTFISFE